MTVIAKTLDDVERLNVDGREVLSATQVSATVCPHGNLQMKLYNRMGQVFAVVALPREEAVQLIENSLDSLDAHVSVEATEVAQRAKPN